MMLSNGMKPPDRPATRTIRLYIQSSKNGVMNISFFPIEMKLEEWAEFSLMIMWEKILMTR